jgi:gamma-glutamyltranspeptidase/glutathione hydrolase
MERREFLKAAGGTLGAAAFAGVGACADGETAGGKKGEVAFMDEAMLRNRNQNRSAVVCQGGIVCASQPLASLAGVEVLKAGGNAIDAAICANAVLGLVEPMNCGPGGDLFAIVWSEKERKLYGLNASGRSPYDWTLDEAKQIGFEQIPLYHPLSWSVPGCVSGWAALQERFGRLNMGRVLEAAIHYAREGFVMSPVIADAWAQLNPAQHPTAAKVFMPEGKAVRYGDVLKNPGMADSLELIAKGGARAFYEGEIAERIVKFSKEQGGRFSMRDFRDHTATWVEPVSSSYRGYDVWELPPNGQGIAALEILNLLEHFDIGGLEPNSAEQLHLFIEAKKLAFEDRAVYYADMDFADVPVRELISKEYAAERVKLINPKRAATEVKAGRLTGPSDTVYLTVADSEGNMVSLIQSIYHWWGSRYVPPGLGFCLQNRGQLFSLNPEDRNKLEPHKRPFHTIIPAFVTKGDDPVFSFGVMGGDFQPQGHAQVLMNTIDFKMSVQQAGEQPRVYHAESSTPTGIKMVGGGSVEFERGIGDEVRRKLAAMGHKVTAGVGAFGGYQGIWRKENPRRYFGGSDPRKDGCAIGY